MTPRKLGWISVAVYLTISFAVFAWGISLSGFHFIYSLDDPYIHLAMAENIAHGHYGINSGEPSSPSSSILWPFLLVPFAGTRLHSFVPLLWNLFFGTASAAFLGFLVCKWFSEKDANRVSVTWRVVFAILLMQSANLVGLTFLGMEHVLQILLAICCAYGLTEIYVHREAPLWTLAAAAIAPSVRYEDLSITLALCLALCVAGRWARAATVFGLSLVPLIAFGAFLRSLGLPALPESMLLKGGAMGQDGAISKISRFLASFKELFVYPTQRIPTVILVLILAWVIYKSRDNRNRLLLAATALVGVLQLLVGHFGWLHRYEVFAVLFMALVLVRAASLGAMSKGALLATLIVSASLYFEGTLSSALCSRAIYLQQYQMHRFVTEYYDGNFAVNDLGWVSFQRPPGTYVLDLWGLGSPEAAAKQGRDAAWLQDVVQRKHADLVMIYPQWFPQLPPNWVAIGQFCERTLPVARLGGKCVTFYSSNNRTAEALRADFKRFSGSLPKGDTAEVY